MALRRPTIHQQTRRPGLHRSRRADSLSTLKNGSQTVRGPRGEIDDEARMSTESEVHEEKFGNHTFRFEPPDLVYVRFSGICPGTTWWPLRECSGVRRESSTAY